MNYRVASLLKIYIDIQREIETARKKRKTVISKVITRMTTSISSEAQKIVSLTGKNLKIGP